MFKDKSGKQLGFIETVQKGLNRINSIFLEGKNYVIHLVGNIPIHHFRRFVYRLSGMKIGHGTTIHMYTRFYDTTNISIGSDTVIGEHAVLDGRDKLEIGSHVALSTEVMIYNSEHDIESDTFKPINEPVIIDDYVFIGPRAIILPGVKIGRGAIVAAGAVVTKDVPPSSIVGGVPAKIIGERKNKNLHYRLGRYRWFR